MEYNELKQPVGDKLPDWKEPGRPARETLRGTFCRLEALDADRHAASLHAAYSLDVEGRMWTYLPYGPFASLALYRNWMEGVCRGNDPLLHAIIDSKTDQPVGVCAYLRIDPVNGSIEVGHLGYSPLLQRTPAATEAMFLMMQNAFALGYRRYEWKCHAFNTPSRAAAQRLGFSFEGLFRQATVVKGRNRDTAWFSIIDSEWPALKEAFLAWLSPDNFDAEGKQRQRLTAWTGALLKQRDPALVEKVA